LKKYHLWLYIVEKYEFKVAPRLCGIHSKPSLNVENLSYIVSGTLACASMHVYAHACKEHVYTELEHGYTYACMRMHALGFSRLLFSKNSLFGPKISYSFHKNFPQVNFD